VKEPMAIILNEEESKTIIIALRFFRKLLANIDKLPDVIQLTTLQHNPAIRSQIIEEVDRLEAKIGRAAATKPCRKP
jgi:hypothetical protein